MSQAGPEWTMQFYVRKMGEGNCLPFESWTIKWKITAVRSHLFHHVKGPVGKKEERKEKLNIIWAPVEGGEGNGIPLQYSCLENPMDGGAWWAAVHGVAKSRTRLKWLISSSSPVEGFPGCPVVMNPPANAGDLGSTPGSGWSPRNGKGYPLQCSCLGNPMDEGSWQVIVHGVTRVRHTLATKPPPLDSLGAPLPAPPWNFQLQEP